MTGDRRVPELTEWQSIETAPKGLPVLLYLPFSHPNMQTVIAWFRDDQWRFKNHTMWGSGVRGLPSHWMPLPAPPAHRETISASAARAETRAAPVDTTAMLPAGAATAS